MSLSDRAVLASLSYGKYEATVRHRAATKSTILAFDASLGSGDFYAKLFAKGSAYDALCSHQGQIRLTHYSLTRPWERGEQLLPIANHMRYVQTIGAMLPTFDSLKSSLLASLPSLIADSKAKLGHLADTIVYPTEEEVERAFWIKFRIKPLLSPSDFRCGLDSTDKDLIRRELEADEERLLAEGDADCWDRLTKAVSVLRDKCRDFAPGSRVHDSIYGNIRKLVEVLPDLNVSGDPALSSAIQAASTLIPGEPDALAAQALKDSATYRATVQSRADAILATMKAAMDGLKGK